MNKSELLKDLDSFSALEGDAGDRIIEHLAIKFAVFDGSDEKTLFKAGYDEGVRALLTYLAYAREDYSRIKEKVARQNG